MTLEVETSVCVCVCGLLADLSVCKDGGVVSLQAALDEALGAVRVDALLLAVHIEDVVVGEGLVLPQEHLRLAGHHVGADVAALDLLFGQLRADPGGRTGTQSGRRFTY